MFARIKQIAFAAMQVVLLLRFVLLIADPVYQQDWQGTALPFYDGWRGLIDVIYLLAAYIQAPVQWGVQVLVALVPSVKTDVFPVMASAIPAASLQTWLKTMPGIPVPDSIRTLSPELWAPGYVDWMTLAAFVLLFVISPLIDKAFEFLKNLVWNLLIEFSYTEKKQKAYQDALEKRAADIMKLNVQYKSLSRKTTKLSETVMKDEMTGTFNKRFFLQRLEQLITLLPEADEPLSLMMMDIDYFKKVNDTYGHLVGDEVLIQVAQAANELTPRHGYCCRYGGEEFGVILPNTDLEAALRIAQAINHAVPPMQFSEESLRCSISIGVASVRAEHGIQEPQQLIKIADEQLYRAKQEGRNRVCYAG